MMKLKEGLALKETLESELKLLKRRLSQSVQATKEEVDAKTNECAKKRSRILPMQRNSVKKVTLGSWATPMYILYLVCRTMN